MRSLSIPLAFLGVFLARDLVLFDQFVRAVWRPYGLPGGREKFLYAHEAPRLSKALELIPERERVLVILKRPTGVTRFGDWKSNYYLYPRPIEIVPDAIADQPRAMAERYGDAWIFAGPSLLRLVGGEMRFYVSNRPE
ncbi:MAG: hypothetical protein U1E76_03035 [Planctomycetota bacterium]